MRKTLGSSIAVVIAVVILACSFSTADTLILRDGSRHSGAFVSATSRIISFKEGTTVRRYNRSKIQSIEFDGAATTPVAKAVAPQSPARPPATVTLPALQAESHCPAGIASVTPRFVQRALIVIPVRVNQKGPFDFMVDTGSQAFSGTRAFSGTGPFRGRTEFPPMPARP